MNNQAIVARLVDLRLISFQERYRFVDVSVRDDDGNVERKRNQDQYCESNLKTFL